MSMGATKILEKAAKATAAMATQYVIVKPGADDNTIAVATAASDKLLGICQDIITTAQVTAGVDVNIAQDGISNLKLGDTVTFGDLITSDGTGFGVVATSGQRYVGMANAGGVSGDVIPVKICFGTV